MSRLIRKRPLYPPLVTKVTSQVKPEARASWGESQSREVQLGASASFGTLTCRISTIFILIHFYLMNATNRYLTNNDIYTIL